MFRSFQQEALLKPASILKRLTFYYQEQKQIIQNVKKENIKAYIRLSSYKPGKYVIREVDLNLPSEIFIKRSWPPINVWILESKKQQP